MFFVNIKAFGSSYTQCIYVVFDNNDFIDEYQIYRDNKLIATFNRETDKLKLNHQGEDNNLRKPCTFENTGKHTGLFKKTTEHEIMFEDSNIKRNQEYAYSVKYYRGTEFIGETSTQYVTLH